MGLSSIILNTTLMILAITTVIALTQAISALEKTDIHLRDYSHQINEKKHIQLTQKGFNYTNTTNSDNLTLYFLNTGEKTLEITCIDMYMQHGWVNKTNITKDITPKAINPRLLDPTERLAITIATKQDVGSHNASLVTCEGKTINTPFNASRCPDNECTGGEYCPADNTDCPDQVCYLPQCAGGCRLQAVTNNPDPGDCDATGKGCATNSCTCDGTSTCCGTTGSTTCTRPADCCSGTCNAGTCS